MILSIKSLTDCQVKGQGGVNGQGICFCGAYILIQDKREIIHRQMNEPICKQCSSKKGKCYGDSDILGSVCVRREATLRKDVSGEGTFKLSFDDKQFMMWVLKSPNDYGPSLQLQSGVCVLLRVGKIINRNIGRKDQKLDLHLFLIQKIRKIILPIFKYFTLAHSPRSL